MYYSQLGQDSFIDNFFNGKENGIFIEIGANDGKTHSNTLFFEEKRNWTGICIEPLPDKFELLNSFRKSINLNLCVSNHDGETIFTYVSGYANELSGIYEDYHPNHINRINSEVEKHGGEAKNIVVKTKKLQTILNDFNITEIDYCSIDTEGSEMKILNSIDYDKSNIKIFSVENNYNSGDVYNFLLSKGYSLHTKLHWDDIYIKKDYL